MAEGNLIEQKGRANGERPWVVWCMRDGVAGHESQVRGLVDALSRRCAVEAHKIKADETLTGWWQWARGVYAPGKRLPRPDMIVGAGKWTHGAILAARRVFGGRAVVLMKPTLGRRLFDLCLVPLHDEVPSGRNVIVTRGVLNTVIPSPLPSAERGLFLIGGPSKHHHWPNKSVVSQVQTIVTQSRGIPWKLTTSRRTPASFARLLRSMELSNLEIIPCEDTPQGWVSQELAAASRVWVSEDSVSMVYEAITAGHRVGLLELPHARPGRVVQGIQDLVRENWLTSFSPWRQSNAMDLPPVALNEAERCAEIIYGKWLQQPAERPAAA